jgi:hypothetical protein
MFGTKTVQLECRVLDECQREDIQMQDWKEKTIQIWFFLGFIFPRVDPPDATTGFNDSTYFDLASYGEVDQSLPQVGE